MGHCDSVFVFTLGMLLCVGIAIVVILLIASPSFREGERILTPEGEEKVQNVRRRAASMAARAEQDAGRSADAVRSVVQSRKRGDGAADAEEEVHDDGLPQQEEPSGEGFMAHEEPADEDRSINLTKLKGRTDTAEDEPDQGWHDRSSARDRMSSDAPARRESKAEAHTALSTAAPALSVVPAAGATAAVDRTGTDDDAEPESVASTEVVASSGVVDSAEGFDRTEDADPAAEAAADPGRSTGSNDGGFFSRITDSINRSAADRGRTGPRHARF